MFNYNRMESMIAQSGKTKLHLCRAMGVSKTYLRDAKKQGTDISGEKLHILAAELNTTPEYLRGETDDPAIKKERPALTFGESHNFQECNFMFWSVFVGLCAKREVSPNAVAKALGLSSGSVTLWKNGAVPRSTTIRKIADYFGVSPESFLAEADNLAIKKAPGINAEGFVPTMRDWEEQAESWTDDQILQAMQKLVEIQQRRRSDGR